MIKTTGKNVPQKKKFALCIQHECDLINVHPHKNVRRQSRLSIPKVGNEYEWIQDTKLNIQKGSLAWTR